MARHAVVLAGATVVDLLEETRRQSQLCPARAVNESEDTHDHLGGHDSAIYWNWSGESPVEIVLVLFILILFFSVPRTGCGIDKSEGDFPVRGNSPTAGNESPSNR